MSHHTSAVNNTSSLAQQSQNQQSAKTSSAKITTKKVDIVVAGNTYTINCPINEEKALQTAADHIHHFILELRRDAPHLSHEDLLVLCCLNLYEKIQEAQADKNQQLMEKQRAETLLEKIIQDSKKILA